MCVDPIKFYFIPFLITIMFSGRVELMDDMILEWKFLLNDLSNFLL